VRVTGEALRWEVPRQDVTTDRTPLIDDLERFSGLVEILVLLCRELEGDLPEHPILSG